MDVQRLLFRSRDRHALTQVVRQLDHALVVDLRDLRLVDPVAVDRFELLAEIRDLAAATHGIGDLADLPAEIGAGPAQMGLQDPPYIHARRQIGRASWWGRGW